MARPKKYVNAFALCNTAKINLCTECIDNIKHAFRKVGSKDIDLSSAPVKATCEINDEIVRSNVIRVYGDKKFIYIETEHVVNYSFNSLSFTDMYAIVCALDKYVKENYE